jgi:ABC-2 type transport system permease protein
VIPQLKSEWLKLRTTRPTWGLLLAAGAMVTFIVVVLSLPLDDLGGSESPADAGITAASVMSFGSMAQLFVLALAVMASAGEFRHQTITATLLARPNRLVVITAKTIVCSVIGFVYGLVTGAIAVGGAVALVELDRVAGEIEMSTAVTRVLAIGATSAAWAALGVAFGMLVRNQIVALVASVAYVFVIDGLLELAAPDVWKWLPSGAADAITAGSDSFLGNTLDSALLGGLVLTAWVTATAIAAAELLRRRDVS